MTVSSSTSCLTKASLALVKKNNLPFTVQNYKFTNLIGHGGFAEVYLVEHVKFGRQYVAKVMTVDPSEMHQRWEVFDAEVTALSNLDHPNIVRLYEHFYVGSQFYLILQYCAGGSLHDEIHRVNGLAIERFIQLGRQIVDALNYCHEKGIAHRDIKPGNILLDDFGNTKLADFGLSLKTSLGQLHRSFGGSFVYTAPEIFQKKPHDPMAGDVWALGVVFVTMASGSSPWQCDSLGALKQLAAQGTIQLKKPVPDIIMDLVNRMIVVDPSKRITMREISQHALFAQPKVPRGRILSQKSRSFLGGNKKKLQWNAITRVSYDSTQDYDLALTDDFELPAEEGVGIAKSSSIHSASSMFLHAANTCDSVRARVRPAGKRRSLFEAIKTFEEVEEVDCLE